MNRKITLFAFAGNCGGLGASGLARRASRLAAAAEPPKKPSR
jgi:hypothetical protein